MVRPDRVVPLHTHNRGVVYSIFDHSVFRLWRACLPMIGERRTPLFLFLYPDRPPLHLYRQPAPVKMLKIANSWTWTNLNQTHSNYSCYICELMKTGKASPRQRADEFPFSHHHQPRRLRESTGDKKRNYTSQISEFVRELFENK